MSISSTRSIKGHCIELPLPRENVWNKRIVRIIKFSPTALLALPVLLIAHGGQVISCAFFLAFRVFTVVKHVLELVVILFENLREEKSLRGKVNELRDIFFQSCLSIVGLILPIVMGCGFLMLFDEMSPPEKRECYKVYQNCEEKYLDICPPFAVIAKEKVALNIQTIREKGNIKPLIYKDLPTGIDPDIFEKLFSKLFLHLSEVDPCDKIALEKHVEQSYGCSLSFLKANLADKPFIHSLFEMKGKPDDPVDHSKWHLYWTIKMILQQSTVRENSLSLSPQEYALLAFSTSVQNCRQGQREGLAVFYSNLPTKYRSSRLDISMEDTITNVATQSVQDVLGNVLASEELFGDLILGFRFINCLISSLHFCLPQGFQADDVWQVAHQTLYLKNRLGYQIGYRHHLINDVFISYISDSLVNKTTEELVQVIFHHCSVDKVLSRFKKNMEEIVVNNLTTIAPYLSLSNVEIVLEKCVEFDEFCNPKKLTDFGAVSLLKAAKYLI